MSRKPAVMDAADGGPKCHDLTSVLEALADEEGGGGVKGAGPRENDPTAWSREVRLSRVSALGLVSGQFWA